MAVAAVILSDSSAFGGPVAVTSTGFNWRLFAVVHDTVSNHKETLQDYSADTLDADSLATVRDKIVAATKAAAIAAGFPTLDIAVLPSNTIVNPVP